MFILPAKCSKLPRWVAINMYAILVPVCYVLVTNIAIGQEDSRKHIHDHFYDGEFFFVKEYYVDALAEYMEVYKQGYKDNANLNYLIGICYLNIPGKKDKAIEYFLKAKPNVSLKFTESSLNEKYAPVDLLLYLGNAYRINSNLDDAIDAYRKYFTYAEKFGALESEFAKLQIAACCNAKKMMDKPLNISFKNMGGTINHDHNDYRPVISGDGNTLIYMVTLPLYDAVFMSTKQEGVWKEAQNITGEIQSDGNQYVCDLSFDGTKLLLAREENMNSDIYIAVRNDDGTWNKSEPFKELNSRYWESHASFSHDEKLVYFTSNRKGSIGQMDIYSVSYNDTKRAWGEPENLGNTVNSALNEESPMLSPDGNILYFSSQGHNGIGGFDIYSSTWDASKSSWTPPKNLGYPLNTTDDDLLFYPVSNNSINGYISRYSDEGYGMEDIFEVTVNKDLNDETAHINKK